MWGNQGGWRANNGWARPAVSGAAATTFDSGHNTGWTLSGGNLIATRTSGIANCSVWSVATTTASQKVYVELTIGQVGANTLMGFGVDNTLAGNRFGGSASTPTKGATVQINGNFVDIDSANDGLTAISGGYTSGNQIDVALDTANLRIWFRKNNGIWNNSAPADPATNTGGFIVNTTPSSAFYFFLGADANTGDNSTARFSSASWLNAAPSGFTQLA